MTPRSLHRSRRARAAAALAQLATAAIFISVLSFATPAAATATADRAEALAREVDARCRRIEAAAVKAMRQSRFADAAREYERLRDTRLKSPYLAQPARLGATGDDPDLPLFHHRVETGLYDRATAQQAFALWRAGDAAAVERLLEAPRPFTSMVEFDDDQAARLFFSDLAAFHAASEYGKGRWESARLAYDTASHERLRALSGRHDDEWGRQQLNAALAALNARNHEAAEERLRTLGRRLPDYRKAEIARHIAASHRGAALSAAGPVLRRAQAARQREAWADAARLYDDAVDLLAERGVPAGDPALCEVRHEHALALWREGDLAGALDELLELRELNRGFRAQVVARQIELLEELL